MLHSRNSFKKMPILKKSVKNDLVPTSLSLNPNVVDQSSAIVCMKHKYVPRPKVGGIYYFRCGICWRLRLHVVLVVKLNLSSEHLDGFWLSPWVSFVFSFNCLWVNRFKLHFQEIRLMNTACIHIWLRREYTEMSEMCSLKCENDGLLQFFEALLKVHMNVFHEQIIMYDSNGTFCVSQSISAYLFI